MNLHEYARCDAIALMELVRDRQVTPAELRACAVRAIETLNPRLNFMSGGVAPKAAFSAGAAFSGLPFLLKESHGCVGHPLAQGSRLCAGVTSPADSEFVRRLKVGGVDILGATTAPEFGIYNVTESALHGATRNPWNPEHSPGGSSGGSSAAVAAGVVPVASSSDGGGSIRGPAHCTGLFGLKPSRARVPCGTGDGGLFPFAHFHVSTRSVRDSAAFLDVVQGPEPGSRYSVAPPARPFIEEVAADPGRLKIAVTAQSPFEIAPHEECRKAVEKAARLCETLGHFVEEATPALDWAALEKAFIPAYVFVLPSAVAALERFTGRKADRDTLEHMTLRTLEFARTLTVADMLEADAIFQVQRRALDLFFEKYDAWITPTGLSQAPAIGEFDPSRTGEDIHTYAHRVLATYAGYTPLLNVTGHPAASVPLHHGANHLPAGVQLVTRMGDEATLLRLSSQWEQAAPWRDRHPPISVFSH
jgi:amidase